MLSPLPLQQDLTYGPELLQPIHHSLVPRVTVFDLNGPKLANEPGMAPAVWYPVGHFAFEAHRTLAVFDCFLLSHPVRFSSANLITLPSGGIETGQ